MRVLQIHNVYSLPGGEDTIVETEASLLESAGHLVDRVRVTNPTDGVAAVSRLARAPRNTKAAAAISDRLRSDKPDIAHIHNTWFSLSPEILHRVHDAGVPLVMTLQNYRLLCVNAQLFRSGRICTDCVNTHVWRGVAHRCYRGSGPASLVAAATTQLARRRHSFDLVDRFLAPSDFVKGIFVGAGVDAKRIIVRPNVIDDPGPRVAPPSASKTFVYAGRLSAEKGVATLLEGWSRSGLAARGFGLKVFGGGPLRQDLELNAPAGVAFAGWARLGQLRAEMLSARALLFPSEWYENFGRVIIEAMAAGLPVMASDIATPGEIVGPLGSPWLVPVGQATAWGRALAALVDNELVDRAGIGVRELFEKYYTLEQGLETLLAVYQELASLSLS